MLFLVSVISHNALNLYGTVLSMITCVQTFIVALDPHGARPDDPVRWSSWCVSAYFAIGVSGDFISHFVDIVLALLVVLVPWTAINLIDFYLIHRGHYDLYSIFARTAASTAGSTGRRSWPTCSASLVQIPFMNTPLYAGPVAELARTART